MMVLVVGDRDMLLGVLAQSGGGGEGKGEGERA